MVTSELIYPNDSPPTIYKHACFTAEKKATIEMHFATVPCKKRYESDLPHRIEGQTKMHILIFYYKKKG